MQTYTHYALTNFLGRKIKARQRPIAESTLAPGARNGVDRLPRWAHGPALIGSVAPDMPLTLTFLVFLALDRLNQSSMIPDEAPAAQPSRVSHLFGTLFFHDWRIKCIHNLFHAPILTALFTLIGYLAWKRNHSWGAGLFWFGLSCSLHTAIDIPLHYDDGPLLLFPFDWHTRFESPVSYWDTRRYGGQFRIIEHLLLCALLLWLVVDWWKSRRTQESSNH